MVTRRGMTRSAILEASVDLFGSRGFSAVSLDDIAGVVGVAKQTVLYWFPSKDELLDAVLEQTALELAAVIEAAVRREVFEESGIRIGKVRYLASQPWVFPASLMIGCIATAQTEQITLDPIELQDARWVTREELISVQSGTHPLIKRGRKGAIAQFLIEAWLQDRIG